MSELRQQRGHAPPAAIALWCAAMVCGCRPQGDTNGPPQHYDNPGEMIGVFEADERDAWQMPDKVVRSLAISDPAGVVADIGAGSGYFTRRLAYQVPEGRVYAVDVDGAFEDYILENRESWGTPNIEPHLALYEDPLLPPGQLDLVFTANTYAYIRDRAAYFSKVREALKPDGRLVVIDFRPDAAPPGNIAPDPKHRIAQQTAVSELAEAGFVLDREESFLPHQWFLILKRAP
jgi:predicted methyltransferase